MKKWPSIDFEPNALELLDSKTPLSTEDRLWPALRAELIQRKVLADLACDIAERMLPAFRAWAKENSLKHIGAPANLLAVTRRFIKGKATIEELRKAREANTAALRWAFAQGKEHGSLEFNAIFSANRASLVLRSPFRRSAAIVSAIILDAAADREAEVKWQIKHVRGVLDGLEGEA